MKGDMHVDIWSRAPYKIHHTMVHHCQSSGSEHESGGILHNLGLISLVSVCKVKAINVS
jgi:hypothetical protein